jgi:hypothetical protein
MSSACRESASSVCVPPQLAHPYADLDMGDAVGHVRRSHGNDHHRGNQALCRRSIHVARNGRRLPTKGGLYLAGRFEHTRVDMTTLWIRSDTSTGLCKEK